MCVCVGERTVGERVTEVKKRVCVFSPPPGCWESSGSEPSTRGTSLSSSKNRSLTQQVRPARWHVCIITPVKSFIPSRHRCLWADEAAKAAFLMLRVHRFQVCQNTHSTEMNKWGGGYGTAVRSGGQTAVLVVSRGEKTSGLCWFPGRLAAMTQLQEVTAADHRARLSATAASQPLCLAQIRYQSSHLTQGTQTNEPISQNVKSIGAKKKTVIIIIWRI